MTPDKEAAWMQFMGCSGENTNNSDTANQLKEA